MTVAFLILAALVLGTCMGLWLGRTHRPRVSIRRAVTPDEETRHLCILMDAEERVEESRRTWTGLGPRPPDQIPRGHGRQSTFYTRSRELAPRVWVYHRAPER